MQLFDKHIERKQWRIHSYDKWWNLSAPNWIKLINDEGRALMKFIYSLSLFKLTCWSMSRKFSNSKMFHVKVFAAGLARWKCSNFVRGGRGPTIWSDGGGKTNARDRSIFVFIIYLYCIKSLNFIHWYCNVAVKHVLLYLSIYKKYCLDQPTIECTQTVHNLNSRKF